MPVDDDAVLGSQFFRENKVDINYTLKYLEISNKIDPFATTFLTIPARTVITSAISLQDTSKIEGYISRLNIDK